MNRHQLVRPGGVYLQRGMTLVELVITIVIIGIAAAAMFSAMASITARSADPMLRQQSLALAEAYLEAVSVRPYNELSGQVRAPAQDINGNAILPGYWVTVAVDDFTLNGLAAKRIEIIVEDPSRQVLQLAGYRTDY